MSNATVLQRPAEMAVAVAVLLYLPCRAFARFKRSTRQAWVRYF